MVKQLVVDLQTMSEDQVCILDGQYETEYTHLVIGICPVLEPVQYHIEIKRNQQDFFVRGQVRTRVMHPCVRCLRPVEIDIKGEVEVVLLSSAYEPKEEEVELKTLENVVYYRGSEFDLLPHVQEAILLEVPDIILCQQDCAGLCPYCGLDLNEETNHQCQPDELVIDDRLAVLKQLQEGFQKSDSNEQD